MLDDAPRYTPSRQMSDARLYRHCLWCARLTVGGVCARPHPDFNMHEAFQIGLIEWTGKRAQKST